MTINQITQLSNDQILHSAPSAGASRPQHDVSRHYNFISTMDVVDILRNEGWYVTEAKEQNARAEDHIGFQKHLVKFQYPDLQLDSGEFIQAVLFNSHDRSSAYKFDVGIYRLVCSNGLVVGDSFESIHVRHMGIDQGQIIDASKRILREAPQVAGLVGDMRALKLTGPERAAFATASNVLINQEKADRFNPDQYLYARRWEDGGSQNMNLWSTLNNVQENMTKGGMRGWNPETKKRVSTRAIKAIDRDHKLNKALFTLAEKMLKIKKGE